MVSLTLSVPPDLKQRMDRHREILWSQVVRSIISQQLDSLDKADSVAAKSRLSQEDVNAISSKVDSAVAKRWKAMVNAAGC